MNHTSLVILAIFGSLIGIAFTSYNAYADNMACRTFVHNRDTTVCLNHNSHTVMFGNYVNQRDNPIPAAAANPIPAAPAAANPIPASSETSSNNDVSVSTSAITLPAHTLPSQIAPVTFNLQFNTPMTVSIPGVGKIMATASQPLSGETCNSRSYPVNSNIGPLCLTFDWSTLS
ncbi:MAG TPA: hypothetical protein VIR31_03800 [Nitrososphaeraceae archaeon]